MSQRRARQPKLNIWFALLLAVPTACATGVQQEFDDEETGEGPSTGGALMIPSTAGSNSVVPKAGSSSSSTAGSGAVNPFGGSSSSGGKAGSSSTGEGGDSELGGSGGTGGASGGSGSGGKAGGGGTAGSGSGPCGCVKTLTWVDDTVLNWGTNDCVTVATTTFKYVGTKAQTWANKQCNPTKQEVWCTDSGNDYKFMACP